MMPWRERSHAPSRRGPWGRPRSRSVARRPTESGLNVLGALRDAVSQPQEHRYNVEYLSTIRKSQSGQ
jgi:hypothetical protein